MKPTPNTQPRISLSSLVALSSFPITLLALQACALGGPGASCSGNPCGDNGICVEIGKQPSCVCDEGYFDYGLQCVPTNPGGGTDPSTPNDPANPNDPGDPQDPNDGSGGSDDPGDDDKPDPDPPATGSCLLGTGDYVDAGPYATATLPGPSGYTVFYPTAMDGQCKHPIMAWGNGTGVNGTSVYQHYLKHLASWGIVAIASHSSSVGSGQYHRNGIDWLIEQNADSSSTFYNKLSLRAGVAGHSQGGIGASAAVSHANVEAEVNVQGGGSSQDRPALLLTGTSDFMQNSIEQSYKSAKGPAFLASYQGADHINTPTQIGASSPGGIQYKRLQTAWFRCFLADDKDACAMFKGGNSCGICNDSNWAEMKSKQL